MHLKKPTILLCAVLALLCVLPVSASAASSRSLTVGSDCGGVNDSLYIPITVDNPASVAGAAFTLQYPKALSISVASHTFDAMESNEVSGTSTNKLFIAAASEDGNSTTAKLMTLRVRLNSAYPSGDYDISIFPSKINNTDAGLANENIDLLTGFTAAGGFSVLLEAADYGNFVTPGTATFASPDLDSDEDGYSDYQECVNETDPDTPTAPGGNGYVECTDSRVDKQKVELSATETTIGSFQIHVDYDASEADLGIGLYVCFDSSQMSYQNYANLAAGNDVAPAVENDSDNVDGNPDTDQRIKMSWTGVSQSARLVNLNFEATSNADGDTPFNVVRYSNSAYMFCDTNTTVNPCPMPKVNSFSANDTSIDGGQTVTLTWDTSNGTNVGITDGVFTVATNLPASGSKTLSPQTTTTYYLNVSNACGLDTATVTVNVTSTCVNPSISNFSASPTSISAGDSATLSWNISNATSASISGLGIVSARSGSYTVRPSSTTTYVLTASNSCGQSSRSVRVIVGTSPPPGGGGNCDLPVINSLTVTPDSIQPGGSATLSWNASGVSQVTLVQGVFGGFKYPAVHSITVSPPATRSFEIVAANDCGSVSKSVEIYVGTDAPPNSGGGGGTCTGVPGIPVFSSDKDTITYGGEATLSWEISGATAVEIDNGVGVVNAQSGSVKVSPEQTTTYKITAINNCGQAVQAAKINVDCVNPGIGKFLANGAKEITVNYGDEVTLSWQTSQATAAEIDHNVGSVADPSNGSVKVTATKTTTYNIIASNACGGTAVQGVKVNVNCITPGIGSFTANGENAINVNNGDAVDLAWKTTGASNVSIDNGVGEFEASTGSVKVSPSVTTTYKLTAANDCGATAVTAVRVNVNCIDPGIAEFSANKSGELAVGESVTLTWRVNGADNVYIDGIPKTLDPSSGSIVVNPEETTRYVLNALNDCGGKASAAVTVKLCSKPEIKLFKADPAQLKGGSNETTLYWEISGADVADIAGVGNVDPVTGSKHVTVEESGSFTLRASNDCGNTELTIPVSVVDNVAPQTPQAVFPNDGQQNVSLTPTLQASAFVDEDPGDIHVKTRWQVAAGVPIFTDDYLVFDEESSLHLTEIEIPSDMVLDTFTLYYWRVSYSDGSSWSIPSEERSFSTTEQGPTFDNGLMVGNEIGSGEPLKLSAAFADGNGNPMNTDTVKACKSQVNADVQIGIKADNATIEKFGVVPAESCIDLPELPDFPTGLFEIALKVANKGDAATVTLSFSEAIPEGAAWLKWDPDNQEFYDYELSTPEDVVLIGPDRMSVTLKLKDGGYGDLISNPDGRIIDPGGFAIGDTDTGGGSSSGGGGGGGCFINTLCGN